MSFIKPPQITAQASQPQPLDKLRAMRDGLLDTNSKYLDEFRHIFFKAGHSYEKLIKELDSSHEWYNEHIVSRITASGISLFSAVELAQDLQHATCHSVNGLISCVTKVHTPLQYPSNYRNVALIGGEMGTHLMGTLSGSVIGIVSPKYAAQLFLPQDQTMMETRPENMTTEEAGILYGMLDVFHKLCRESNLQYAITAGTVLGKERHGGIIPWDDDVDLFMLEKDESAFLSLEDEFAKYDLALISCRFGYKVYYSKGKPITEGELKYNYPFIDVAIAKEIEGKIAYRDDQSRQTYSGEYYTRQDWAQLKEVDFGPVKVYALKDGSEFVRRCYGETAMEYGFTLLNHRTFRVEFPTKYYLEKNVYDEKGVSRCNPIAYDNAAFEKMRVPNQPETEDRERDGPADLP